VQRQILRARVAVLAFAVWLAPLGGAEPGNKATYVGGTVAAIPKKSQLRVDLTGGDVMSLWLAKSAIAVPYRDINTIEYGMRVSRRYLEAVLISPMFLVAKKRTHFLTIGYEDGDGRQQAVVLEVNKDAIRSLLVSLEARTGRKVEFQDEEARKAGRG
jgi:hypothetical protein